MLVHTRNIRRSTWAKPGFVEADYEGRDAGVGEDII